VVSDTSALAWASALTPERCAGIQTPPGGPLLVQVEQEEVAE
jgi:hypothetical protein